MRIDYVTLKNFGPHENFEIEMVNGLIGIFGRNGAGKSTFVNGIYAALTNDFSRFDGTKADCIYDQAGPKDKSFIEIEAEHEGTRFKLLRSLRPNKSVLTVVGGKPITKATEIEVTLREELGVDMKLVDKYVFVDQWAMFQFLSHTPAQRADAFKHLCRTEKADACHTALGNIISAHAPSDDWVDNSDELVTAIAQIETEHDELMKERDKQSKLMLNDKSHASAKRIVDSRRRQEEAAETVERLEGEIGELEEKVKNYEGRLGKMERKVSRREKSLAADATKVEHAKAALANWRTYDKRRKRKRALTATLAELQEEGTRFRKHPKKPEDFDNLKSMQNEFGRLKGQLTQAEDVIRMFDDNRDGGAECPTCHQTVDEDFLKEQQNLVDTLPKEVEALSERIDAIEGYKEQVAKFDKDKADWEARLASTQGELEAFGELKEPSGDRSELLQLVEDYQESLDALEEERDDVSDGRVSVGKVRGKLQAKGTELTNAKKVHDDNEVSDQKFEKANKRLEEHAAAKLKIAEIDGVLGEKEEQLAEKKSDLAKLRKVKKRRKKLDRLMKVAGRAREAFHWNQLPRMVAQGNLVNMEKDINETLDWFGNPYWAEADENLGFQIHLPGGSVRRAEGLSGGQKGVLAIAFRVGVNSLFGADIGMMWLDEPTAGLDDQNIAYFEEALVKLAAEVRDKRQLVVITHAADLKPAFDQVIEIG
jgi:exonuclease SbcC